jgi:hypothetical protein
MFYILNSPKLLYIKWWHIIIIKLIIFDNNSNTKIKYMLIAIEADFTVTV